MNKCYNIVWNAARNMYVVASELSRGDSRIRTTAVRVLLSVSVLTAAQAWADDYAPINADTVILQDGDTVISTTGGTGIDSQVTGGEGIQISGKAIISVSGDSGSTGIKLDNGIKNNFGEGTEILVTDSGTATNNSTIGIYIDKKNSGTAISANDLLIDVDANRSAYGLFNQGSGVAYDLGKNSQLIVKSHNSSATGIYINGSDNTLVMDNGLIQVTNDASGSAIGIEANSSKNATLNLGDNTHIEINSGMGGGSALRLGNNTMLNANGLIIDFTSSGQRSQSSIYGIQTANGSNVDLGEGSEINIATPGLSAYGLTVAQTSHFMATDFDINVSTSSAESSVGYGANVSGDVDFGRGSSITVHGFTDGYGLISEDYTAANKASVTASFKADDLTIDVTGKKTEGLRIEGGIVDLGSGSSVSAYGTVATIAITGRGYSELDANHLTVNTARSTALSAQSSYREAVINIGAGSTLDGRNATGNTTNGLVANTPYSAPVTLNFNGSPEERNAIYAVNGYGASAQYSNATVNISNTDIIMSGSAPYGLWAMGNSAFGKGGIINAENVTIDMTSATNGGFGVMVQQGGAVNLTGETIIKAGDGIAIWNPMVTAGSNLYAGGTVTGSGKMTITGDIINSGWGYIDLSMDAGSFFTGATSVNGDLNAQGIDSIVNIALADGGKWLVTDDSTLSNLANAGTVELAADAQTGTYSTLHADTIALDASSILDISLDAAAQANAQATTLITGGQVTLDGDLHLNTTNDPLGLKALTSDDQLADIASLTLIDADTALQGDFATLSTAPGTVPDFIALFGQIDASDNTQYTLGAGLSWYAANASGASTPAHGTFTLDADQTFTVNSALNDVAANTAARWDGKTLTKEGDGTLILTAENSYSGGTNIHTGTLIAQNAHALGTGDVDNAGMLLLDAQDKFILANLITEDQGVTSLMAGATLDAASVTQKSGSTLSIALDATSASPIITAGQVSLDGNLNITGFGSIEDDMRQSPYSFTLIDADNAITGDFDTLTVAGMNTDDVDFLTLTGRVNATDNTQYNLSAGLSWYAGRYLSTSPAHGTFTLTDADQNFVLNTALVDVAPEAATGWDGKSLTKQGDGTLTLAANNTYSGETNILDGTLWLSQTGVIGAKNSQQMVNVAQGGVFGGNGEVNGNVYNSGTLRFGDTTLENSNLTINGNVVNHGEISSSGSTAGNTLTISGNYTGNDGSLTLNTWLGGDNSPTDQLKITGDATGNTTLYINPVGGEDVLTNMGIEVVQVGGVSSDDAFELGQRVQIGLYEYGLYEDSENWYLRTQAETPVDPDDDDVTPLPPDEDDGDVTPVPPDDDDSDVTPVPPDDGEDVIPLPPNDGGDVTPVNPQYRADIGAYLGNQWLARHVQIQSLHDRESSQYLSSDGNVWARFKGGKAESSAVGGNVSMDSDYTQFQLGGDLAAWNNGQQSLAVGIMGSYAHGNTDSQGNRGANGTQYTASGDVDGYNLGVYATWFADAIHHQGWYIDSWYQYGFYDNTVENGELGSTHYDSSANAISLESGYRYDFALSKQSSISLTPQLQIIWQDYKSDDVISNGTHIDGQNDESWTTRLGLHVDNKTAVSDTVIQPYAEINWLHSSQDIGVAYDGAGVKQDIPADRAELKVGVQMNINNRWNISAQAAGQKGNNDYRDLSGSLNIRYSW